MKKLFIHIGLSKTGSSAIQSWLSLNMTQLKEQGVDYADLNPAAKDGKITSGNGVPLFRACNQKKWGLVEDLIRNTYFMGNTKTIISSETLQALSPEAIKSIKDICEKNCIDVYVIAYARSVYELLYSNYLQGIKRHGFSFKFGERQGLGYKPQRVFLENYYNVFQERLRVINYDAVKGDIFTSFSDLLVLDSQQLTIKNKKVNRSLTMLEADILRYLNSLHDGVFSKEISDYLLDAQPDISTSVCYCDELLKRTRINSVDDVTWINTNLMPQGGAISLDLSEVHFSSPSSDAITKEMILGIIVQWALNRKAGDKRVVFVDFIRDFAVYLEKVDIDNSFKLMKKALMLRPEGPFILKKMKQYELLNHVG